MMPLLFASQYLVIATCADFASTASQECMWHTKDGNIKLSNNSSLMDMLMLLY